MSLSFSIGLILIISGLISLFISYITWKKREIKAALSCSLVMLAAAIYAFGYAFEISSNTLYKVKLWLRVEYGGISFLCALWLILVIQYTGHKSLQSKKIYAVLFIIPVIVFISHYTNDYHKLFYKGISVSSYYPISIVNLTKGPLYWLHISYSYLLIIIGMILYFNMYLRSISIVRRQILMMALGTMAPWLLNIIYLLGITPYHIDWEPLGFTLTGIFYCFGIFRFSLLKLTPIALTKVFETLADAVIILDYENNIVNYNNKARLIIPELLSIDIRRKSGLDVFKGYGEISDIVKNYSSYSWEHCIEMECAKKYYKVSISVIYDNKLDIGKLVVFSDVTQYKEMVAQLNQLVCTDELTKIYNRRYFNEKCETEFAKARVTSKPISIIMLDLDNFKKVNDTYGHPIGDEVLKNIVNTCSCNLKEQELIARYGGEEFAILLPNTKREHAVEVAERLRVKIMNSAIKIDEFTIKVTCSFGVYGLNEDGYDNYPSIISKADKALYQAKKTGRNKVILYKDEMYSNTDDLK